MQLECNLYVCDVAKMAAVFFCLVCGDTKHVQSCSCRRKVKNSLVDGVHVYKLLESVVVNKFMQSNKLDFF